MPETLGELHCLPLAERDLRIGPARELLPIAVLAAAMVLVAFNVVPVAVAFFGAAVILLLPAALTLARGLRRHRMADPDHAGRADPGQRCACARPAARISSRQRSRTRCDFLTPIGHQCNTLVTGRAAIALATIGGSACRYRSSF